MSGPFGVYIHIPFCKSKCKYCAFVSCSDFSLQKQYVDTLIREINGVADGSSSVDTVYIGGGTPSCLYDGALSDIMHAVYDSFSVEPECEITVECNPESVTERFVCECKHSGVNRISMGLQSSCDDVLRAVGRIHDLDGYIAAVKLLSKNFDNISSDLILGLPDQPMNDIARSIDIISDHCVHASVYALSVEEGTPLFRDGYAPCDDRIADMYDLAVRALEKNGFKRYEVSNFARDDKKSKHNLKYWNCEPYLGFGVAAHGYDGDRVRYAHSNDIIEYIKNSAPEQMSLTPKDKYNEYVMLRLRTEDGICLNDFALRFGYDFKQKNKTIISRLAKLGHIIATENTVRISPDKMFVMNGLIEELMED